MNTQASDMRKLHPRWKCRYRWGMIDSTYSAKFLSYQNLIVKHIIIELIEYEMFLATAEIS